MISRQGSHLNRLRDAADLGISFKQPGQSGFMADIGILCCRNVFSGARRRPAQYDATIPTDPRPAPANDSMPGLQPHLACGFQAMRPGPVVGSVHPGPAPLVAAEEEFEIRMRTPRNPAPALRRPLDDHARHGFKPARTESDRKRACDGRLPRPGAGASYNCDGRPPQHSVQATTQRRSKPRSSS